ncbi:MAG: hypothetical protein IJ306_01065 [Oscillospiraceae bacterium]|nr:hypothetical protein [Oscillospiraceae bacterium]
MEQGWVSLHRQIRDHWLWADKPFSRGQAWVDMILRANHEEKKVCFENSIIEISAGGFLSSETALAEAWGWSRRKTHSFIDVLMKDGMLETKRNGKGTVFFLVNYSNFSIYGTEKEPEKNRTGTDEEPMRNRTGTAQEPMRNTNNNDNNYNNENKERIVLFSPAFCGKVENSVPDVDIDFHWHRLHDRYGIEVTREEVGELMRELPNIDKVYSHFGITEK